MSTGITTVVPPKIMAMGVTPASVDVVPGDVLQFTNNSAMFSKFEVIFLGTSPNNSGLVFTGTSIIDIPVTKDGTFQYLIKHFSKGGGPSIETGTFAVRSCTGGCH
jgi:plastocyanin